MCKSHFVTDPNSQANTAQVATSHLHIAVAADFNAKVLRGSVVLSLAALEDGVSEVILDTNHLEVSGAALVQESGHEQPLQYQLGPVHPAFGSALSVKLPSALAKGSAFKVRVHYATTTDSGALQFLAPEQTVGKKHPYLFTQCQAIHARSLVPCADSPSQKLTYSAEITAPAPLRALMSADSTGDRPESSGNGRIYTFEQRTPMPSYLIALVIGELEGIKVGPRTTVWSEPQVVKAAAEEFSETERFIAAGEELLTPYDWAKYDLLVLPPSFPYGGMENPCLTFVTPTLVAGDKSLVDVIAHEIAHSWMGNLVTTKNWEHFWLNEGWTVFVERKIVGRIYGHDAAEFSAILGYAGLQKDIDVFGAENPLTNLIPDLSGIDPDDSFSRVPYEKGFNLLYYLEKLLGGPEVFEPFMKAYVQNFAGKTLTSADWKAFLYAYFGQQPDGAAKLQLLDTEVDWDAWLHSPGMPPVRNEFDRTLADNTDKLSAKWAAALAAGDSAADWSQFTSSDVADFTSQQKTVFLETLIDGPKFTAAALEHLDAVYGLSKTRNCEIRFRWLSLCLKAEYASAFPQVVAFLLEQGRMKYTRPLYRQLFACKNNGGDKLAVDTFVKNKATYHPICQRMVEKDLSL